MQLARSNLLYLITKVSFCKNVERYRKNPRMILGKFMHMVIAESKQLLFEIKAPSTRSLEKRFHSILLSSVEK
jgi:hypothetical protein